MSKYQKLEHVASIILILLLFVILIGIILQVSGIDPFEESHAHNVTYQQEITNRTVDMQQEAHVLELRIGNILWKLRIADALLLSMAIIGLIAGARHMFGKIGIKEV